MGWFNHQPVTIVFVPQDPGKLMKLEGAVIAVTGGASGLGAATAQLCVERGAKVAVLDMNKEIF